MVKKRSIVISVILSFLTCGLYGLYWIIKVTNEMNTSGSLDPSHVLLAIGRPHEVAHGSLRLSLCEENTEEDVEYILQSVPDIVEYLRGISPLWKDKVNGKRAFLLPE